MRSIVRRSCLVVAALAALAAVEGAGVAAHAAEWTPEAATRAIIQYNRPATYGTHKQADLLVPMRDGFKLTCDLWRPANSDGEVIPGRFPSLLVDYFGYGRRYGADRGEFYSKRGYSVLSCNTRGAQGLGFLSPAPNSVGLVDPFGPKEQEDGYDVIEWLAAQPYSTGRVGQTGNSYGGITTLMVAGRQVPPSLKAIIPIHGITDLYQHFVYPGGVRTSLIGGDSRGSFNVILSAFTGDPTASIRTEAEWTSRPTYSDYWEQRAFDPTRIRAATLMLEGTRDFFSAAVDSVNDALRDRDNYSLLLGPWEHDGPESASYTGEGRLTKGPSLAWFDRWVAQDERAPRFPKALSFETPNPVDAAWLGHRQWPPASATPKRWYLAPGGELATAVPSGDPLRYQSPSESMSFDTPPLETDRVLAGPAEIDLRAAFSSEDAVLIGALLDVAPDGSVTELAPPTPDGNGRAYLRLSHRDGHRTPVPAERDKAYDLRLRIPSKYWRFKAGHRVRLQISGLDSSIMNTDSPFSTVSVSPGEGSSVVLRLADPAAIAADGRRPDAAVAAKPSASCRRSVRLPRGARALRVSVARHRVKPRGRTEVVRFTVPPKVAMRPRLRVRVQVRRRGGRTDTLIRVVQGCR